MRKGPQAHLTLAGGFFGGLPFPLGHKRIYGSNPQPTNPPIQGYQTGVPEPGLLPKHT